MQDDSRNFCSPAYGGFTWGLCVRYDKVKYVICSRLYVPYIFCCKRYTNIDPDVRAVDIQDQDISHPP